MPETTRKIPNPESTLLQKALIGGVGLGPSMEEPPPGYASVVLFVPTGEIVGKTVPQIQSDLGLPWVCTDEKGVTTGLFIDDILQQQAATGG